MASAQVLPNSAASSRKQGHLELGKKKLEEFRRKKAAKKAPSSGQSQAAQVDHRDNLPGNNQQSEGEAASAGDGIIATDTSASAFENRASYIDSSNQSSATSNAWGSDSRTLHANSMQESMRVQLLKPYEISAFSELANGYHDHWRENHELSSTKEAEIGSADGLQSDKLIASGRAEKQPDLDKEISSSSFDASPNVQSVFNRNSLQSHNYEPEHISASHVSTPEKPPIYSAQSSLAFQNTSTKASEIFEVLQPTRSSNNNSANPLNTYSGGKLSDAINRHLNVDNSPWHASEPSSFGGSGYGSSSDHARFPSSGYGTTFGRSRPSFLDSLGVPRVSSVSSISHVDSEKLDPPVFFGGSKFPSISSPQQPTEELNSMEQSQRLTDPDFPNDNGVSVSDSTSLNDGQKLDEPTGFNHIHGDEFPPLKKDEDFSALEQHIEDLTREKFSLQRALETAQSLAESLAAENSSLTDSFNQQGKVINQLRSDMERLQEEIKAQLLALDSVKLEYANAQLECNAADERAKILASEVITLEEKALRLRSNELKLEKQLENLSSEISSYKRKVSILQKERQELQSTVDAMQEEKKLLQSKLRKASSSVKGKDTVDTYAKRDASTSTDDLASPSRGDHSNQDVREIIGQRTTITSGLGSVEEIGPYTLASSTFQLPSLHDSRTVDLSEAPVDLPHDQLRMIENIRSLISELSVEKEELVQALRIESSNCSKLKESNKEFTQKLEAQTQMLELLTAQRIANENVLVKPIDTHSTLDTTEYADEGDEVVERVLGWIMKLFPGGPAKRRTSKLL